MNDIIDELEVAPLWLRVALLGLLAARVTILLTADRIAAPYRRWMSRRGPRAKYFATCPWCSGLWIAVAVVVAWALWERTTLLIGLGGALACVAGALGARLPDPDPE